MKTEVEMMSGKEMEGEKCGEKMREQKTYSSVLYTVLPEESLY